MIGKSKQRNSNRNAIKIVGFVSAFAVAITLCVNGQYVEVAGVIASALSSPLNSEVVGVQ